MDHFARNAFSYILYTSTTYFSELVQVWEQRRQADIARIEAERAEKERLEREAAAKKAAEEAMLREKEMDEAAKEGEEGEDEDVGEKKSDAEEDKGEEMEPVAAELLEVKPSESVDSIKTQEEELQSRGSEEVLPPLNFDSEMPPDTPETEAFKKLRLDYDRDFSQLISVVKGTNNVEPIFASIEPGPEDLMSEIVGRVEAQFNYRPWEYTGMDLDEEEEDFGDEEEEDEEEMEDPFIKDKKKVFGDTKHFCPVMLKERNVLWPGSPECAARYRERTYFFSSQEARSEFMKDPGHFIAKDKPLEVDMTFFVFYQI